MDGTLDQVLVVVRNWLPTVLSALAILIIGWLIAFGVSAAVRAILGRTKLDDRLAGALSGHSSSQNVNTEKWISSAVFWLIMVFVLIAFFQALNLTVITTPLNRMLGQFFGFLPNLFGALILLGIAWLVATVLRLVVSRALKAMNIDQRVGEQMSGETPARPATQPANAPDLAAMLGVDPETTTTARSTSGSTSSLRAAAQSQASQPQGVSLSDTLAGAVYWLIFLLFLPAILDTLNLQGLLAPIQGLLNEVLTALPNIFGAALVLGIAFFVGKILSGLVSNLARGFGFDRLVGQLTSSSPEASQAAGAAQGARVYGATPEARKAAGAAASSTPSDWLGTFVLAGVMLFAAIAAFNLLGLPALTTLVTEFAVLVGRILLGLVIFGIGLFLANQAARAISSSRASQAGLLALTARVAIIALAGAMALRQMGLANEIINLAFGLTLGAIAVAFALAFGLGAREVAGREAERMVEAIRSRQANARATSAEQRMQQGPAKPGAAPGD